MKPSRRNEGSTTGHKAREQRRPFMKFTREDSVITPNPRDLLTRTCTGYQVSISIADEANQSCRYYQELRIIRFHRRVRDRSVRVGCLTIDISHGDGCICPMKIRRMCRARRITRESLIPRMLLGFLHCRLSARGTNDNAMIDRACS